MAAHSKTLTEFNENFESANKEIKKFSTLQLKRRYNLADIKFLKLCRSNKVTPVFVKKIVKFDNNSQLQKAAEKKVLETEICKHYANLNRIDLEAYKLRSKLIDVLGNIVWENFEKNMLDSFQGKMRKKTNTLKKKFTKFSQKNRNHKQKIHKPNIGHDNVINLSKVSFNEEEMNLLNQGSKNCIKFSNNLEEYIVDIQLATSELNENEKVQINDKCIKVLDKVKNCSKYSNPQKRTIQSLRNKQDRVVYTKADKGNKTVILNKEDYNNRMSKLLEGEEFSTVNCNPLNKCTKKLDKVLKEVKVIPDNAKFRLKSNNPILPRMYGLPKIHKSGEKMRPIINNIGSPTYKLAKWLTSKFNSMEKFESLEVKNSYDFLEKIKNIRINDDDCLVSFDVVALFPSIPRDKILIILKNWLIKLNVPDNLIDDYVNLTEICLEQSYFTYEGKIYLQKDGLSMGNPLSPFLANLYMSDLEMRMVNSFPYMFKEWHRYVDDIFAIVPQKLTEDALKLLNIQDININFTLEIEEKGMLPFLDLEIHRQGKGVKFGIHRKETHTSNYINNKSYNPTQHKLALFNSLAYRLVHVPMEEEEYNKEYKYILNLATTNGFEIKVIKNIIMKVKKDKQKKDITSLQDIRKELKFKKFTFHPTLHNKFQKIFKNHNIMLVPINRNSINNILGFQNADTIPSEQKSGIYQINCKNCDKVYIGQTKRNVKTRMKEHFRNIKNMEIEKSAVAAHAWNFGHQIENKHKLLKNVSYKNELLAWEKLFIVKNSDKVMNFELPTGDILLNTFMKKTQEGATSNTRPRGCSDNGHQSS